MRELRQRKKELKVTEDKWDAVWMLSIIKKRKKINKFVFQTLRDIVKQGGDDVIKRFEDKFKEQNQRMSQRWWILTFSTIHGRQGPHG